VSAQIAGHCPLAAKERRRHCGADTIDVYLCPGSFLDDMGVSFKKGDEIALTGSKVKQDAADLILAREVVKGTETLVLRDDKGKPIWDWHR